MDLARDAQVHFKREVQEWKDVLLRGHTRGDYAKYWSLFEKEESTTQALLQQIKDRDPEEDAQVDKLLAGLHSIGQRYRTAIGHMTAEDPLSYRIVDAEVRGMDRPLTDQMSEQVARLQARMAALGTQMSAANQAEISRLRDAVLAAAALGVLSMVMLMLLVRRSERARAEASALAKSAFLATMSHEIRTPMNAVLGMANLLAHTSLTATQSDYLAKLQAASKHLLGIIDDILDLSKIEASRLELEHLVFSLDDVLDDVATLVGARAAAKGIELVLCRQPNVPVLMLGDPLRLGQIVSNLASNAVKFTEKGEVQIAVSLRGWEGDRISLRFEVIDTGIGLLPEEQDKLFQPFAQADGSTTRRFGGTGLGLAICARLVKMMGGTIGVQSEVGRGSRFFFTIPLRSRSDDRRQQPGIPPVLRGRHILIGEPNATMREALTQALRGAGLAVTSVADGGSLQEALLSPNNTMDLVILNWRLNATGIWDLLTVAKDKAKICPDRLLVLASQIDAEEAHAALRTLGFGVLLIKPASPSTLFEAVARAFGLEQRSRSKRGASKIAESSEAAWQNLRGLRVLLVEDNAVNQEVAAATLRLAGLSVSVTSNGQDAVDCVRAHWDAGQPFSLVLMDRHMPGIDGLETTRQIRLDPRFADLPIIAMTADVVGASRDECHAAGMNDFVSKPFAAETLFEVLGRWASAEKQAASTTARPSQFPTNLPGIDVAAGLGYLAGEQSIYRAMLMRFREDCSNAERRIADLLAQGKRAEAEREAHSMKGLAGQIAAHDLCHCATELYRALKSGDHAVEPLVAAFGASLSIVLGGLRTLDAPDTPSAQGSVSEERLTSLVEQLSVLVSASDPDARKTAERLRDALSGDARIRADGLLRRLDRYDFEGARDVWTGVIAAIESTEETR
jgi:two-component system sensor histidine kinase/response regulator